MDLSKVIVIDFTPWSSKLLFGLASNSSPFVAPSTERVFDVDGHILSWESFSKLLDHIFNQLDVSNKLSECTVVFGHSLSLSPAERQKVLHIMFEEKKVQSCWVVVNSSLALAVAGETSGLVIDIGSKKTILYPVYEMNVPDTHVKTVSMKDAQQNKAKFCQDVLDTIIQVIKDSNEVGVGWDAVLMTNTVLVSRGDVSEDLTTELHNFLRNKFSSAASSSTNNSTTPNANGTSPPSSPQPQHHQSSLVQIKASRELLLQGTFLGGALIASLSSFKDSLLTQQNYTQFEKPGQKRTFENGQLESVSEVVENLRRLKMDAKMYSRRKDELHDTVKRLIEAASSTLRRDDPMVLGQDPLMTSAVQAPLWVPDQSRTNCMVCNQSFSFMRRKHHCRGCGRLLCNDCTPHRISMPRIGFFQPERACTECFKKYSSEFN